MSMHIEPLESRSLMAVDLQGLDCYVTDTARWGQVIAVSPSEIRNTGTTASGAFRIEWYLSKDTIGSSDVIRLSRTLGAGTSYSHPGIASGGQGGNITVNLQLPSAIPAGWNGSSFHVIMKTDSANQIAESSETNNFGQIGSGYDRDPITITTGTPYAKSPYGVRLGEFNGVENRSNAANGKPSAQFYNSTAGANTGLAWECVEYVNRYYYKQYGMDLRSRTQVNASGFFKNTNLGLDSYTNKITTVAPQVGDILCFGGGQTGGPSNGHVAIIRAVTATSVTVIQQNVKQNSGDASYTYALSRSADGVYTVSPTGLGGTHYCQGWMRLSRPAAPTNLVGSAASSSQINLSWTDNSNNESGFRISRWNGSAWVQIGTMGANVKTFGNTGLSPSTTYYYQVASYNQAGSTPSQWITVVTPAVSLPTAPSNLTWSRVAGTTNQISLHWRDNSSNEQGFRLQFWTGSTWQTYGSLGANITSSLTDLPVGQTWYLRVAAYNAAGEAASAYVTASI